MPRAFRPEVSKNSPYWIPKHRYYELKHFVMQYPEWKKKLADLAYYANRSAIVVERIDGGEISDPTAKIAEERQFYKERIEMVEKAALRSACGSAMILIEAVTKELPYDKMMVKHYIPYSRDEWYIAYRRFFWLLDAARK